MARSRIRSSSSRVAAISRVTALLGDLLGTRQDVVRLPACLLERPEALLLGGFRGRGAPLRVLQPLLDARAPLVQDLGDTGERELQTISEEEARTLVAATMIQKMLIWNGAASAS